MRPAHRLHAGQHVGELGNAFLHFPVHEADGLRVQAGPSHLGEVAAARACSAGVFCVGRVDPPLASSGDGLPGPPQRQRQPQLAGKDIHRAERQHGEPGAGEAVRRIGDAVEDFVERPITARSHHGVEAVSHGLGREAAGISGALSGLEGDAGSELIQMPAEVACLVALGGGIEDDTGAHAGIKRINPATGATKVVAVSSAAER